ncbi:MAG: 2-dehydropantoate 2-reductase [Dehalococcoidia bacterium]|nr:2-dehydropantoate 2-reductase [Dehalococcoidia bacterium]
MRYVVYGAGGIGGGIGAELQRHGYEVVLIARGDHLERMRRQGLTLRTPAGSETLPVHAVGHPSEIEFRDDDVVILAMKSQDTEAALEDLYATAGPSVPVLCAQNGVENERRAARRFERVYGTLVFMPATYLEPGVVLVHCDPLRGVLDSGRYPHGTDALLETVCADLEASGFSARPDPAIMRLKYRKLLGNLGNAVQAVCGLDAPVGDLLRALRAEAHACYEAADIDCATAEELDTRVSILRETKIEGEARAGSSTWQSVTRGQGTVETDYLNGEVVLLGALHGVATPANRILQQLAEQGAREGLQPGWMTPDEILDRASPGAGAPPAGGDGAGG